MASLSQGRTAAAQCGLFTHKSVPVIFEPSCTSCFWKKSCLILLLQPRYKMPYWHCLCGTFGGSDCNYYKRLFCFFRLKTNRCKRWLKKS